MKRRKNLVFGFSAVAGFTILSSVAFACTWIQGTMKATGSGAAGSAVAIGSGGPDNGFDPMTWCVGPGESGTAVVARPGTVHVEITPYAGNPTAAKPECIKASQLPDSGTLKGPGSGSGLGPAGVVPNPTCTLAIGCSGAPSIYTATWTESSTPLGDCMNNAKPPPHQAAQVTPTAGVTPVGTGVQVNAGVTVASSTITISKGKGQGDYYIDGTAPTNGGLCVSDVGGGRGNQVALTII